MKTKTQVLLIHGGMTFKNRKGFEHWLKTREISFERWPSWTDKYLTDRLGKDFEVIRPRMPLSDNATYAYWKLHFERLIPLLKHNSILIGNSLGGIFLAKYLSEHTFPKKLLSVYLVCPPFDDSLSGEDLAGGFTLKSDLSRIEQNAKHIYLMFSADDDVVPVSHAEKYREKLLNATISIYTRKHGHFRVATFPEIITKIKKDVVIRRPSKKAS